MAVNPAELQKQAVRTHRASRWCVLALVLHTTQASAASIVIDGSFADWSGIPATATDPSRDSAPFLGAVTDLLSVHLTNDSSNLYALLTYAGTPFLGSLLLNTDNNSATGATV